MTVGGVMLAGALLIAACGDSDSGRNQPSRRDAYTVMIDWLLETLNAAFGETCENRVVFVEAMGASDIALGDQVDLVNDYEDSFDIRFIDSREEATDDAFDHLPVRDECVLIGFGPMANGADLEVRAETYHRADEVSAYRFELTVRDDGWVIVGNPQRVDAEGLVIEQ